MSESVATAVRTQLAGGVVDVVVKGILPIGDTTETVTHFIVDPARKTVVGQVALPNAVAKKTAVSLTVKVPSNPGAYAVGAFDENGVFRASSFLSVHRSVGDQPSGGPVGRVS
jgi:hypothetical protein